MRTKLKAAVLAEQQITRERSDAFHDARALAIELGRGEPSARFDPMEAGVVLQPREIVYRRLPIWIRVHEARCWAVASYASVIVTDIRLLCRFSTGRMASLWWSGVVGVHVDLAAEHVVLDFGDGQPVDLSGAQVAPISVAVISSVYGAHGLVAHPALGSLRGEGSGTDGTGGR